VLTDRVLVTGAGGCIGSWVLKALVERGADVTALDLVKPVRGLTMIADADTAAEVRPVLADVTDADRLVAIFSSCRPTKVVHLAGLLAPDCARDPARGALVNVSGSAAVFSAALSCDVRRVVYTSSMAVIGKAELPGRLSEAHPCSPQTEYGIYKRATEELATVLARDRELSAIGLRPATVVGVGRETGLTSDLTRAVRAAALSQEYHVKFAGIVDIQDVRDVAAAIVTCTDISPGDSAVYNLRGTRTDVGGFLDVVRRVVPRSTSRLTYGGPPFLRDPDLDDGVLTAVAGRRFFTPLPEVIAAVAAGSRH
jgi:nucleoside-diphosphate-sugar epimerase